MPFLPRFSYFVNCFRTHRPPTRVWETVSRAKWASPADAAYDPLFAHMPDLWDLRAEHQEIWANPKQTQTTQWPHVPPNAMARKLTTNDQLQYFLVCQGTSFIFFYILLLTTAVLLVAIAARPHVNPGPHQQKGYNVSSRTLE